MRCVPFRELIDGRHLSAFELGFGGSCVVPCPEIFLRCMLEKARTTYQKLETVLMTAAGMVSCVDCQLQKKKVFPRILLQLMKETPSASLAAQAPVIRSHDSVLAMRAS